MHKHGDERDAVTAKNAAAGALNSVRDVIGTGYGDEAHRHFLHRFIRRVERGNFAAKDEVDNGDCNS